MLKFYTLLITCLIIFFGFSFDLNAQSQAVNYEEDLILDSDLDGLTNEGERQIFGTDELNPDSDGDGFLDGAEVMSGFDPLDRMNQLKNSKIAENNETPWAWYSVRALGLVGFMLLYLSIFFGLFIRIPFIRKIFGPIATLNFHRWFSLHAVIFIFFHGFLMIFDSFYEFSLLDSFVPFYSSFNPLWLSLGIIGFYLMIVLVITSYLRSKIPIKLWKGVHYLSAVLYVGVVFHALQIGTDLKIEWVRILFHGLNVLLAFLIVINIFFRIKAKRDWLNKKKERDSSGE